jgi:hypothetical protein
MPEYVAGLCRMQASARMAHLGYERPPPLGRRAAARRSWLGWCGDLRTARTWRARELAAPLTRFQRGQRASQQPAPNVFIEPLASVEGLRLQSFSDQPSNSFGPVLDLVAPGPEIDLG